MVTLVILLRYGAVGQTGLVVGSQVVVTVLPSHDSKGVLNSKPVNRMKLALKGIRSRQ